VSQKQLNSDQLDETRGDRELATVVSKLPGHELEPAVEFTKDVSKTTFSVEYGLRGPDLVFHFFLPPELLGAKGKLTEDEAASLASRALSQPSVYQYWVQHFAAVLDPTARSYFQADSPRLTAAYTQEVSSWWLRAKSFDHLLDVPGFAAGFFQALDDALDPLLPAEARR
jgi:hypothetical protein